MKFESTTVKKKYLFLPLLLLVTSIALLVRIEDLGYVAESLWAEDTQIFLNQAHAFGIRSLWITYAGYHYLYHRIIALLASQLPLSATPYIFFLAWLMSFFSIVWVLASRAKLAGLNELLIIFLVSAIALQPSHAEPFFNLVHAHFFLGIALALHICIPSKSPVSAADLLFLLLASLSGPFSVFMTPILALQLMILRDFSSRKASYIIVPICGLIQAIYILGSGRINHAALDRSATHWLQAISTLLFFGRSDKFAYVTATLFWSITLVFFVRWIATQKRSSDRVLWVSPLIAALSAITLYLVGALAAGAGLSTLSPLDMGSRYFLIPYSLAFYIALACTQHHREGQTAVISLISLICAAGFLTVDRPDRASTTGMLSHANMQWVAFTKFQKIRPDLVIPTNPPWPTYPPWWNAHPKNVDIEASVPAALENPILLSPQQSISAANRSSTMSSLTMQTSPTLYFDIKNYCLTSTYLAIEIDIWRSRMGRARVHWGRPGAFDSRQSLERFYPNGPAVMQFAFRRDISDYLIKLDPAEGVDESEIVHWLNGAREYFSSVEVIVAEPTKPGGETRINEVRLFCLH